MGAKAAVITLTQVAEAAGVAVSTASYALRGNPLVQAKTAERIRAVAQKLGYKPNSRVAALMAHIRRARPVLVGERIAFVWIDTPPGTRFYSVMLEAARTRAEQFGYVLEEFWLDAPGMTARRLAGILNARGIVGVILSPLHGRASFSVDWPWAHFAPAVIGNATCSPELDHSGHHHYIGMRTAMLKLMERGHRRIYALLDSSINERAKRGWSSAFLEHHPDPDDARSQLLLCEEISAGTVRWLKKARPEALVSTFSVQLRFRDAKIDFPELPGATIAMLDWRPNTSGYVGIDQCEEVIAANAVDLVVGQLHRNERGIPAFQKMLLFPGVWRDGAERV